MRFIGLPFYSLNSAFGSNVIQQSYASAMPTLGCTRLRARMPPREVEAPADSPPCRGLVRFSGQPSLLVLPASNLLDGSLDTRQASYRPWNYHWHKKGVKQEMSLFYFRSGPQIRPSPTTVDTYRSISL
jgi:hypothetical protein